MTNQLHSYAALYYPFIHFKDDRWLKTTALYWDRMGRIVPETYLTDDSQTVHELGNYVETLRPSWVRPVFGETFIELVTEHGERLRQRYGVALRDQWADLPSAEKPPAAGGPSGQDPRLSYVYYEKMTLELAKLLKESDLALPDGDDPRWLGMHPKMAAIYTTALADELAGERGMVPLTDETLDHLSVGGWSMERLAQALLDDVDLVQAKATSHEVEGLVAHTAIQTVLPKDLDTLPVDRILAFREKYRAERAAFQGYITDFLKPRQWLDDIHHPDVLEQRLQDEYDKVLKPKINDYREMLRDVNIDTVLGVMGVQIAVPSLLQLGSSLLGMPIDPVGGMLAGAALTFIPVLRDRRKKMKELRSSPVSYLLRMEEELRPREVTNWISETSRRFRTRM